MLASGARRILSERRQHIAIGGMDIKRDVERLHAFPERLVSWIVEVDAIGVAVDHRPNEA